LETGQSDQEGGDQKAVGKRERGKPEEAVDKAVARLAEATGSLTGDETLEAEGRALGRTAQRNTYRVVAQPEAGWIVEGGEARQVSSVHQTKDEAARNARELAKPHKPSQLLVYKKDGTVQTERTYG
jgi:predicted P-loop ATPase